MKTELSIENKAKFNAQYWHQKVLRADYANETRLVGHYGYVVYSDQYLLLKPLSSITDEDAIEISKIDNAGIGYCFDERAIRHVKSMLKLPNSLTIRKSDYLRSKGYALPWMGLSVEEMVLAGWIKLITS